MWFTLCCFVVYSTRRFVVCLSMCHFVIVFFSPFSIAITSLGEERANLSAFRTFVRFLLVSSSSWGLGRAAVCDCGHSLDFSLTFFYLWSEDMHVLFLRNPKIILFYFFHIFNLDIFRASVPWKCFGVGTL